VGRFSTAVLLTLVPAVLAGETIEIGIKLVEARRPAEAIRILPEALAKAPDHAMGWKALGVAYAQMGDYHAARAPFERSCKLNPKLADTCFFWARSLYAQDRFEDSLRPLELSLKHDGKPGRAHTARAQSLWALGKAAEAETEFRKAISAGDSAAESTTAFGAFLTRQGRSSDALPLLEKGATAFPNSGDLRYELGRTLIALNRPSDAVPHLAIAAKTASKRHEARILLSKTLIKLGRAEEGLTILERNPD
jgi:Tfp pilus assembly protein PilF